jgi:hypothetical protein
VTVARWDGPTQTILYLIVYSGASGRDVTMTVPNTSAFDQSKTTASIRGAPVTFNSATGVISLHLQTTDAIILSH